MRPVFSTIGGVLLFACGCALAAEDTGTSEGASPLILQIRVIEGDSASYAAGSRSVKGITVEVTDEAGLPVSGAAVSFRLPEDGPTGVFQNGARTEIASTSASGRATVWGMKWNRIPGSLVVRVTAAKGETRAGALVTQILVEPSQANAAALAGKRDPVPGYRIRPSRRWLFVSALAAAAAGGGLAFGARSGSAAGAGVSAAGSNSAIVIGSPSISVGR